MDGSRRYFLRRSAALSAAILGTSCGGGGGGGSGNSGLPAPPDSPVPPPKPDSFVTLSIQALRSLRPFCELSPNVYLVTDDMHGNYSKQLATFSGDIVTGSGQFNTIPTFNLNDTTARQGLYTHDGDRIVSGRRTAIQQVWALRSGTFLMMARADDGMRYLHRVASAPQFLVGTSGNNRAASLHFGSVSGTGPGTVNIYALHQRSLCDAIVNGQSKIILAEYNVAAGRVDGAANDQVIAWISVDDGVSFSKLLEFNTAGVHQFDHFHAVIQDRYNGTIYFLTGDDGNENAIISWDGTSPAPPPNASLESISKTAGWAIIYGDERMRYGDIVPMPGGTLVGLPDSDRDPGPTNAYVAYSIDTALRSVQAGQQFSRQNDITPIIALRHSSGALIYGSLRTSSAATAGEPYHHFWTSVDGQLWTLAAKIRNYSPGTTGTVLDLWEDSNGNVIAGVCFSRGVSWGAAEMRQSSAVFRLGRSVSPQPFTQDS